jgi:hypothetical protein
MNSLSMYNNEEIEKIEENNSIYNSLKKLNA